MNVDVVYLDFSKAFDKLDFKITLNKLQSIGIVGKLHTWIKNFLTGRKQAVCVENLLSKKQHVISGVPQGSVLGPLIFLILLGDIDSGVHHCSVSSFADDTRILGQVSNQSDVESIQADLNLVYRWSTINNMKFNADKFDCLRYGYDEIIKSNSHYMSNESTEIESKTSLKDLGVLMSSSANFDPHVNKTVVAANLKAGWVLRTFRTREPELMLTLWKSLVLPILDYCCQLWAPSSAGSIQALENVQKAYLSKISGMYQHDYWQQLSILRLYSLQRRRERYIIIYVWKIIEGLVPNFGINTSVNLRTGRFCVVPHVRSSTHRRVQSLRFASLSVNGPRLFNSMPKNVRNINGCATDVFKSALDRYLKSVPDEPRVKKLIPYCSRSSNSLLVMKPI